MLLPYDTFDRNIAFKQLCHTKISPLLLCGITVYSVEHSAATKFGVKLHLMFTVWLSVTIRKTPRQVMTSVISSQCDQQFHDPRKVIEVDV